MASYQENKYDPSLVVLRLKQLREERKQNRAQLGRIFGVSRGTLAAYEKYAFRPRVDTLEAWASALGQCLLVVPVRLRKVVQRLISCDVSRVILLERILELMDGDSNEELCTELEHVLTKYDSVP